MPMLTVTSGGRATDAAPPRGASPAAAPAAAVLGFFVITLALTPPHRA